MKEIGSEFWTEPARACGVPVWEKYPGEKRFFLSGRTALLAVIREIMRDRACQTAYLPRYCCHSMAEPFQREGLQVDFYDVDAENGIVLHPDSGKACDIILTADYFGFAMQAAALPAGAVHIHDVTHSLLMPPAYPRADYFIGSLRKWGAVAAAGFACKREGAFQSAPALRENPDFTEKRRCGYKLKEAYIRAGQGDKNAFLTLFGEAEALLDGDYENCAADRASLEAAAGLMACAAVRRENAAVLIGALQNSRAVRLIWQKLGKNDVPLFVPVLAQDGCRDALRRFLIDHQVYCSVHWPAHSGCGGLLYEQELSLICDQRYTAEDMLRIAGLIREFEERYKQG